MATRAVEASAAGHGAEPTGQADRQGEATYLVAIAEALWEEMERDERVFLLGEDIGVYGGAFKVTEGFIERFGPTRVMDTPIVEETIVGTALGAAMEGLRPAPSSSTPTSCRAATTRSRRARAVPLPERRPGPGGAARTVGRRGARVELPLDEPRAVASHAPGLKVICPAFPADAKGL
jgi:Pyruvate/2-oxoglutarate dehydrogenase complex, dehydrogenase (E1) component, eukaryotic type, beta subunit